MSLNATIGKKGHFGQMGILQLLLGRFPNGLSNIISNHKDKKEKPPLKGAWLQPN